MPRSPRKMLEAAREETLGRLAAVETMIAALPVVDEKEVATKAAAVIDHLERHQRLLNRQKDLQQRIAKHSRLLERACTASDEVCRRIRELDANPPADPAEIGRIAAEQATKRELLAKKEGLDRALARIETSLREMG